MIMVQHKMLGEKKVHVSSIGDKRGWRKNPYNDEYVVRETHKILSDTDIIIGHNIKRFDIRMFNGRALFYGLTPIPEIPFVDTLKESRKHFDLNSHSLSFISRFIGSEGKDKIDWTDFLAIAHGCKKALKKMTQYGIRDIKETEAVYMAIRPYMINHPNLNVIFGGEGCPNCGSVRLSKNGPRIRRAGKYQRYLCKDCGASSQGKKNLITVDIR